MTCWYMSFIILITCSFLVYLAEKSSSTVNDSQMVNLADGLYWGIVSHHYVFSNVLLCYFSL